MGKLAAVQNAVLDGHGFTAPEQYGAQVAVRVHAGIIPGFLHIAAELGLDRAGMAVLVLFGKVGNHCAHDIQQIMLRWV